MVATIRVVRGGEVLRKTIELGTIRQLQKIANAHLGRVSGDAVTICRDKRLICSRSQKDGKRSPWQWTATGRVLCDSSR